MRKLFLLLLTCAFVLSCGMVYAQQDEAPPVPAPADPNVAPPAPAEPEKTPEAVKPADVEYVKSMMETIDKQMKDKFYANASRNLNRLMRLKGLDDASQKTCEGYMTELIKIGNEKLKEAEGLVQNDLPGALAIYNDLRGWQINEITGPTQQFFAKMNTTPELQDAMKKAQVEVSARNDYKNVETNLEKKNYVNALYSLVNIINKYPDTATAKTAQAKLDELKKNEDYKAAVTAAQEKEIGRSLSSIAFAYARYNDKDEAVKYHKLIVEKFPKTSSAERSENQIKLLTEEKAPPAEGAPQPPAKKELTPEEIKAGLLKEVAMNMFNVGTAFARYGEKDEALKYLQLVIEKFPDSDPAKRADQQIKVLKGEAPVAKPRRRPPVEE